MIKKVYKIRFIVDILNLLITFTILRYVLKESFIISFCISLFIMITMRLTSFFIIKNLLKLFENIICKEDKVYKLFKAIYMFICLMMYGISLVLNDYEVLFITVPFICLISFLEERYYLGIGNTMIVDFENIIKISDINKINIVCLNNNIAQLNITLKNGSLLTIKKSKKLVEEIYKEIDGKL